MLNSATKIHGDLVSDNLPFTNFQHVNMGQSRSPNVTCQISQFIASGQEQGIDGGKINGDDMGQAHLQSKRIFFRGDLGQVNVDVRQHYSGGYGSGDFSSVLRQTRPSMGLLIKPVIWPEDYHKSQNLIPSLNTTLVFSFQTS